MIPASRAHRRPAQAARLIRHDLFLFIEVLVVVSEPFLSHSPSSSPLSAPPGPLVQTLPIPDDAALSHLPPHKPPTHPPTSHTYPHYRDSVIIAPEGHPVHYVGGPRDDPTLRERKDGSVLSLRQTVLAITDAIPNYCSHAQAPYYHLPQLAG